MAGPQAVYTHGQDEAVLRAHRRRTAQNSAAYLVGQLRPGAALLDVGCGTGTITADLAELVRPGRVAAVDAAPAALAVARQTVNDRGLDNVDLAVADVHALGYAGGTFDVVHAHQVLQHVADPVLALREMRRVCRPGGIVAARDADYAAMTWHPQVPALDEWLALYRRLARANGGELDAGRRLLSWARRAGFTEITAGASAWCFATPADRAWWSGTWAERMLHSPAAGQAVTGGYASRQDLERIAAGWRAWADAEDGWFAVLHGEIRCRP